MVLTPDTAALIERANEATEYLRASFGPVDLHKVSDLIAALVAALQDPGVGGTAATGLRAKLEALADEWEERSAANEAEVRKSDENADWTGYEDDLRLEAEVSRIHARQLRELLSAPPAALQDSKDSAMRDKTADDEALRQICGISGNYGAHLEPLACAYRKGHEGPHAWASLPTFVNGKAVQ